MTRAFILCALLGVLGLMHPNTSLAALKVCNKIDKPLSVAFAWKQAPTNSLATTISWGWWSVQPGACITWDGFDGSQEAAGQATYYYYAHSEAGEWSGGLQLCVHPHEDFQEARLIANEHDCSNGELRGFKPLGLKTKDATLELDKIY